MKVVALSLVGQAPQALNLLMERYPGAEIHRLTRLELESVGGSLRRVSFVRGIRPHVFAVITQDIDWQRAKELFLLFGALAGARECIIVDLLGNVLHSSASAVILKSLPTVVREVIATGAGYLMSLRKLRLLEKRKSGSAQMRDGRSDQSPVIAYLRATPGAGTQAGGAASHIKGVVNALTVLGGDVRVITNDPIVGLSGYSMTTIKGRGRGLTRAAFDLNRNLSFTHAAVQLIRKMTPDFIYQRYARFNWTGVVGARETGRPLFLEYNGSEVWVGRHWDNVGGLKLLRRIEELNLRAAARIFVVSEVERNNLLNAGVPDHKIIVNPNGVDVDRFRPGVGGKDVRAALGVGYDEHLAGFVGTFGPWHGVMEFAKAIALVPRETPLKFLLVGAGKLKSEMEETICEAGLIDRVIFTGSVSHDHVPALLDACDILVSPHIPLADGSDFFGSPTKLFEYMAMGKGIVASRLGQIGDVLSHEETALLVEPGNVEQLAEAMVRLAKSKELRERLGDNARRVAVEKFTWQHNARRVLDAYDEWQMGRK